MVKILSFNLARDGIKYRKSKEIFNIGVSLFARILGALNKNGLNEKLTKYEARYDQLENSIAESNMSASDVEKIKECLKTLKRRYFRIKYNQCVSNSYTIPNDFRYLVDSKEEQAQLDQQLVEAKFNIY